jgi:hypothetical protein
VTADDAAGEVGDALAPPLPWKKELMSIVASGVAAAADGAGDEPVSDFLDIMASDWLLRSTFIEPKREGFPSARCFPN